MCTYATEKVDLNASAKDADGWFHATTASVYYDHPVHFSAGHALMIDVLNLSDGAYSRVGLELDVASARSLALAILRSLDDVPDDLLASEGTSAGVEGHTTLRTDDAHCSGAPTMPSRLNSALT